MDPEARRILCRLSPREREWFHANGGAHLLAHIPPVACAWHQPPTLARIFEAQREHRRKYVASRLVPWGIGRRVVANDPQRKKEVA